jgi:hypothetical protein
VLLLESASAVTPVVALRRGLNNFTELRLEARFVLHHASALVEEQITHRRSSIEE